MSVTYFAVIPDGYIKKLLNRLQGYMLSSGETTLVALTCSLLVMMKIRLLHCSFFFNQNRPFCSQVFSETLWPFGCITMTRDVVKITRKYTL